MVAEEALRVRRSECGSKGGNPNLVNHQLNTEQVVIDNNSVYQTSISISKSSSYIKSDALKIAQDEWFEAWWPTYWKRRSKAEAQKAYRQVVKTEQVRDQVALATKSQMAEMLKRDPQYRPLASSWLRAGSFEDEPDSPQLPGMADSEPPRRLMFK